MSPGSAAGMGQQPQQAGMYGTAGNGTAAGQPVGLGVHHVRVMEALGGGGGGLYILHSWGDFREEWGGSRILPPLDVSSV